MRRVVKRSGRYFDGSVKLRWFASLIDSFVKSFQGILEDGRSLRFSAQGTVRNGAAQGDIQVA